MNMAGTGGGLPRIGILGAGAVGCALASQLIKLKLPLALIGRQGPLALNFQIEGPQGRQDFRTDASFEFDLIFVTVKAYQIKGLWQSHQSLLAQDTVQAIIVLCNGLVDQACREEFPSELPLRLGLTTIAVKPLGEKHAFQFMNPDTSTVQWGAAQEASDAEKRLLALAGNLGFEWKSDIDHPRRRKWLFNTALNPICALYGLERNDHAKRHKQEVEALFSEAYLLGKRLWGPWQQSEQDLIQLFWQLIEQTGSNRNSMAVDLQQKRPTEIEFLAGIYRQDPSHDYPRLSQITAAIRQREASQ